MLILVKIYLHKVYLESYGTLWSEVQVGKEIELLLNTIVEMYEKYPTKGTITPEELELYLFANKQIKEKEKELFKELFIQLGKIELNDQIINDALCTIKRKQIAGQLAIEAFGMADGKESFESVRDLYQKLDNLSSEGDGTTEGTNPFVTDDLETLYEQTVSTPGLRWRLGTLNRMLGSIRQGDFGFVFARPETGKTTFLASEVTHFATQTDRPILWFNNEEQGNKVKIRLYQSALRVQLHELMSDRQRNKQRYLESTGGNIRIFDSASIHRNQVEQFCRKYSPGLVIFDQIDKIKGFPHDEREDIRLGSIYIWARELAKQYCPVIGVCQAGGTAEGKRYLTMDDVTNAKTSKQAEADWILGIGKTHDNNLEFVRHLSVCKNKLAGDSDSEPSLRHGRAEVRIFPEVARYEDIM